MDKKMKNLKISLPVMGNKSSIDPNIPGQQFYLVSFSFPNDDKKKIYGFLKVRGVFPSLEIASDYGEELALTTKDSEIIQIGNIGMWCPITNNMGYAHSKIEVKEEDLQYDKKYREEQREKRKKEERELKEIERRKKELLEDVEKEEDKEDLEYYTTLRVKINVLKQYCNNLKSTYKEHLEKVVKYSKEKDILDEKYPEYKDKYIDEINKKRKETGIEEKYGEEELKD